MMEIKCLVTLGKSYFLYVSYEFVRLKTNTKFVEKL